MIRSSSLKRGRIEGNDAVDNPPGAGPDNKRLRRTISDERNKKPERSVSFEGIPLERSISVGTYERGVAMGRKRRNSNYAIPEILAPWLKGQRISSTSTSSDATSNAVQTTDSHGKAYSFSANASKPRIQVANTRTRALSSFDLTKDEMIPANAATKGSGRQEEKERRDRVVSFGFVTAAEALGDAKLTDEKSSVKSSMLSSDTARALKRSFSAPVDTIPQQKKQVEKALDERKSIRSAEVSQEQPYTYDGSDSVFSSDPTEVLFNKSQRGTAYPTYRNTPVANASSAVEDANNRDGVVVKESKKDAPKSPETTSAKPVQEKVDKKSGLQDSAPTSTNKDRKETAEEKRKRLESSPSFQADIDMLAYDQFSDWHVGDRYKCEKVIGKGSYGSVCQAMDLDRMNTKVAIKRIHGLFDNMADAKRILREIRILRELRHENVIPIMDIIKPPNLERYNELYIVFALRDTDLLKLIHDYSQVLTIEHVKFFMAQLLRGIQYMHNSHVIHRDLKPANILLTESCELSICDFGLARAIENDGDRSGGYDSKQTNKTVNSNDNTGNQETDGIAKEMGGGSNKPYARSPPKYRRQMTQHVATRWYRAPELILKCDYNGSIDVWSAGCIFAEMLTMMTKDQSRDPLFPGGPCAFSPTSTNLNNMPQHQRLSQLEMILDVIGAPSQATIDSMTGGHADNKLIRKVLFQRNPIKPTLSFAQRFPEASAEAIDLLEKLLKFDPSERITVNEAIEHPFLQVWHGKYAEELQRGKRADFSFERTANSVDAIRDLITEEILWYEKTWADQAQKHQSDGVDDSLSSTLVDG